MEETVRLDASSPPERTAQASGVGRETSAETGLRMGVCISRFLPCPLTISLVTPARYTAAWLGPISQCASTCMLVTTADRRGLQPIMQTYGSSDLQWFTFVHGQRASLRHPPWSRCCSFQLCASATPWLFLGVACRDSTGRASLPSLVNNPDPLWGLLCRCGVRGGDTG